jgi:hypothetical protein
MSPLALAQLPKTAVAQNQVETRAAKDAKAQTKEFTPVSKDGAALFEAMKQVMVEGMQRELVQRQAEVQKVEVKPAVRAMVKIEPAARVVRMNPEIQAQRFTQQFRPILRAEYHILRVACRLTPEQRKGIARAAEQTLKDVAKRYLETMQRPLTPAQRAALDPRKLIQEGLSQAVKTKLPAEQAALYQEELTKRNSARKQLLVRNLVARLDHDLVLNDEQRKMIGEALSSHWDDAWCQSLEMFMYENAFLPPIPDQHVAPLLSEPQKKIWRSTRKVQSYFGGFGIVGGNMREDPLEDEELREARLAAAAKEGRTGENQPDERQIRMHELMRAQERARVKVKQEDEREDRLIEVRAKAELIQAHPKQKENPKEKAP